MNNMYPEHLYEMNRQKIERDQAFILKEELMKSRPGFIYFLNLLGSWMIISGEKLRKRYSFSKKANSLDFLPDTSKIFRT
jgi:hypothetical protein